MRLEREQSVRCVGRWIFLASLLCGWAVRAGDDLGIEVPAGFEVSLYADDALAHDIFSMTIDAHGRIVVAGAGYVKILEDTDHDGRADKATLFSPVPASGAHGMVFDGNDLICSGDDSVMRLRDADGDGVAEGPPQILTRLKHPEHGCNGIIRGPDGWYYIINGNDAGVLQKHAALPTSPVSRPQCGAVVRLSPDGRDSDVYAHGFRNPYDLDFSANGQLFTVDADGERDHHLPWYVPTRLFDIAQGMHHGWVLEGWTRSWSRPESFLDNVERASSIGRGSPTGVVAYRHRQFPAGYRGGVFSACWTLGRVYYFPLKQSGATYKTDLEVFMRTTGEIGFAPCDLAVGPEGDLFVAIGGRRTRGSVFRVRYKGADAASLEPAQKDPLRRVLSADQPLASWSRAQWVPQARKLGKKAMARAVSDPALAMSERIRAVEILVELFDGLSPSLAEQAIAMNSPDLTARVAWALSRRLPSESPQPILCRLSSDPDPRVARAAWEAVDTLPSLSGDLEHQPAWAVGLVSPVRRIRSAAIHFAAGRGSESYLKFRAVAIAGKAASPALRLADLRIFREAGRPGNQPDAYVVSTCLGCFASSKDSALRLEALRLLQIELGDMRTEPSQSEVHTGYVANRRADAKQLDIARRLAPLFPTPDDEVNRELARLLGMIGFGQPNVLPALASRWTDKSSPEDDIHYLIVSSLLDGKRSPVETARAAKTLLNLQKKLTDAGQQPAENWAARVGEMFEALCKRDQGLIGAMLEQRGFGRPDHTLFVARMPRALRGQAVRRLLANAAAEDEVSPEMIELAADLPQAELAPLLRDNWDSPGLRDSIVSVLARSPHAEDRDKFIAGLASAQPQVVEDAARALARLPEVGNAEEIAVALQALRQACTTPAQQTLRAALAALLRHWTGQAMVIKEVP